MAWTEEDDKVMGSVEEQPRSPWQLLKDSFLGGALHNPIGAEGVVRATSKLSAEELNKRERKLSDRLAAKQAKDDEAASGWETLSPANIGRHAVELLGNTVGGADPTYVLGPGKSVLQRMGAQGLINEGVNYVGQFIEKGRGVRDEINHDEAALSGVGGAVFQGGVEVHGKVKLGKAIRRGSSHPDWAAVNDVIVNDLEGGGSLAHPKRSPKGAMGPQQVMPETARKPGFGIKPWDGKTQADLARVGRQYSAAMMDKYDGDTAKVLAAYNAGPGKVDSLISLHGDNWAEWLPKETKKYVKNGMAKLDGKVVNFPKEKLAELTPDELRDMEARRTPGDVVNLDDTRMQRDDVDFSGMDEGIPPTEEELSQYKDIHNEFQDHLTPAERQDMDASAPKPTNRNTGAEDVLGKGSVATTPVNDLRGAFDLTPEELNRVATRFDNIPDRSVPPADPLAPPRTNPEEPYSRGGPMGGGDDPMDTRTPLDKLWQALNEARPMAKEQAKAYSEERSARLGKVATTAARTSGEAGFRAELGQLKGSLPKVAFESIRDRFEQKDVDELFDLVKNTPTLSLFDKVNARSGLMKMLGKEGAGLPTESEIKLLSQVFPKEIIDSILKHRPLNTRIWEGVTNALNIPRSMMASFDLSAPFRQGVFMIGRKEFWKSFAGMFKQFGSEKAFKAVEAEIASRPTHKLMRKSGLALSSIDRFLDTREEAFMSDWAEKIPLLGRGVHASNRAYTGFLNKLRADVFDSLVSKSKDAGIDFKEDPKALKDIARFINAATGRGSLGKLNQAAPVLTNLFFSPRLIASRVTMLNPAFYATLSPVVRKEAVKSLLTFGSIALTVLGLAKAGGAEVEDNPTSSDFGKIKVGNTRFDVLGGFQQYIKLGAVLASGEETNSKGKTKDINNPDEYKGSTRYTEIMDFFRSKFSPVAGYTADALDGKNMIGEPFDVKKDTIESFIPLFMQDLKDAYEEYGAKGLLSGIPSIFGVGVQTYKPRPPKAKKEKTIENEFKQTTAKSLDKELGF